MRRLVFLMVMIGIMVSAGPGWADDRGFKFYGLGPRVGFSIDPDQFVFGGQADFGDPFPNTKLVLPVLEIGVGNDFTVFSIGGDLFYRVPTRWGDWTPLVGGELALILLSFDLPNGDGHTNSDLGLSAVVGVEKAMGSNQVGIELKLGLVDSPDFKVTAMWTFGN